MRTSIIYIPGLGSSYNGLRRVALGFWRMYGTSARLLPLDWYDDRSFESIMNQLKQMINQVPPGNRVVVIGESAGATLALHSSLLPSVSRVITLCGVTQPTTPISPYLQQRSPAFVQATRSIPHTKDNDVHSIRALVDPIVGKQYSTATGAKRHTVWAVGHLVTIVLCLTILAPLMITIAKKSKT